MALPQNEAKPMGAFDGWPVELLGEIASYLRPHSFTNFLLTCKTFSDAASHLVPHHQKYCRDSELTCETQDEPRSTILDALVSIQKDPWRGVYLAKVTLHDDEVDRQTGFGPYQRKTARHEVGALLSKSEVFSNSGLFPHNFAQTLDFNGKLRGTGLRSGYRCLALMCVAPNLRRLDLPATYDVQRNNRTAQALFAALTEMADRSPHHHLGGLECLVAYRPEQHDVRIALNVLIPFFAFRGLRRVYMASAVANNKVKELKLTWDGQSRITRLELASCCIDEDSLVTLLEGVVSLTVFKYSHSSKARKNGIDWNAGEFVRRLGRIRGNQLTEVAVTVADLSGVITGFVITMDRFTALQHLEISREILAEGDDSPRPTWLRRGLPSLHLITKRVGMLGNEPDLLWLVGRVQALPPVAKVFLVSPPKGAVPEKFRSATLAAPLTLGGLQWAVMPPPITSMWYRHYMREVL